jgi:hypothetical protein
MAHIVFTSYAQQPGTYHYIDDEGYYIIYKKPAPPTLYGPDYHYYVLNKPKNNAEYHHPLFDYSPYSVNNYVDKNGLFWREIDSVDIGDQARLVYCQVTYHSPINKILSSTNLGMPSNDDLINRYGQNNEIKSVAESYFRTNKLTSINEQDRLAAANYVVAVLNLKPGEVQLSIIHRNIVYASVDYIETLDKTLTFLNTILGNNKISKYTSKIISVGKHMVSSSSIQYPLAWFLGSYISLLCVIYTFTSITSSYYADFYNTYILASVYLLTTIFITKIFIPLLFPEEVDPIHPIVLHYYKFHQRIAGNITYKELSDSQMEELKMPHNKSLELSVSIREVLSNCAYFIPKKLKSYYHTGISYLKGPVQTLPTILKKSIYGTLHALAVRQCGHKHSFDDRIMEGYRRLTQDMLEREVIPLVTQSEKILTMDQHLDTYTGRKRDEYLRAWNQYKKDFCIKFTMECMQKGDEMQFVSQPKPRFLFSPSGSLKVLGTYINSYYLKLLSTTDWLAVGCNTAQLSDKIYKQYKKIPNAVAITWDGSNHDGHQYKEMIEIVDTYLFDRTYQATFPKLPSLYPELYDSYSRILTMPETKFYINQKIGNRFHKVVTGKITGTTFSGHPTRTTLGNSLRVYSYVNFIAKRARITIAPLIAGDDVICFVSKKDIPAFKKSFDRVYIDGNKFKNTDEVQHGLGQLSKDFTIRYDNTIDFLSKYGVIHNEQVVINRKIDRSLLSGNHSNKISRIFTVDLHRWSITTGLESWGFSWPVIKKLIEERKKILSHWIPKNKKQQSAYDDTTSGYAFVHHKNEYDYFDKQEAFYKMYNMEVVSLMEDDIHQAPQYLPLLNKAPLENE